MTNKLILGTVQFGLNYGINNKSGLPSLEKVFDVLDFANNYITCLDTARSYGISEERIGKFHEKNSNRKFGVNTKFPKGIIEKPLEVVKSAIDKLKVSKVDTMMFHSLEDFKLNQEKMELLLKDGKGNYFKKFGISVYTIDELEELKYITEVDVVQVSFNLLDNDAKKGIILSELEALGKEIHVRSCFLQGLFFKSNNDLQENLKCAIKYLDDLNHIAKTNNYSMGELALSYCISKPYIDKVIIGVDSKDQLQQNLKWASLTLNEEVERTIDCIDIKEEVLLNPSKW